VALLSSASSKSATARPHRGGRLLAWGAALALVLCAPAAAALTERVPTRHEVEAAFLLNFASFVEWPAASTASETFVIGVLGPDPFGDVLDTMVGGEKRGGRRIVVRRLTSVDAAKDCNVLYVAESLDAAAVARELEGTPVLTVSEVRDFARHGGMIQFRIVDKRVRFDINAGAARQSGLVVSSHLLKLALQVYDDQPRGR
jgi:hypothetical protein